MPKAVGCSCHNIAETGSGNGVCEVKEVEWKCACGGVCPEVMNESSYYDLHGADKFKLCLGERGWGGQGGGDGGGGPVLKISLLHL